MASRILTWYYRGVDPEMPAYYLERDYTPAHIRVYAKKEPSGGDLQVDIKDDGTSILASYAFLPKGDNLEEDAEDFLDTESIMEVGSVVTCDVVVTNGADGITVQLELLSLNDEEGD